MTGNLLEVVMGGKQKRFSRYFRLGFVALAFVLYPYFVNQMPALATLLQNVHPGIILFVALIFAAVVVVGPELLQDSETSEEELFREFGKQNLDVIKQRLKSSLDQHCYISLNSIESPEDLGRSPTKAVESSSQSKNPETTSQSLSRKVWQRWFQRWNPRAILPPTIPSSWLPLDTRRELENLQTNTVTPVEPSKPILEIFREANRRLLILGEPGSGKKNPYPNC